MSRDIRSWVKSVGQHHPEWSHIVWNEPMLLAIGIDVAPLKAAMRNWACVTNLIRLGLLDRFGGWYFDTDIEALDSLDRLVMSDTALVAFQDGQRKCNAVMAAVPGHDWIKWQVDHFHEFDVRDGAAGVYVATASPHEVGMIPQHYVYPWLYDSPPEVRVPHPDSILCHHWVGSWVRKESP